MTSEGFGGGNGSGHVYVQEKARDGPGKVPGPLERPAYFLTSTFVATNLSPSTFPSIVACLGAAQPPDGHDVDRAAGQEEGLPPAFTAVAQPGTPGIA